MKSARFMSRSGSFGPLWPARSFVFGLGFVIAAVSMCDYPTLPLEENSDEPNANDVVYSVNEFGGNVGNSAIYNLQTRDGALYFNGVYRRHASIGRLNEAGGIEWRAEFPGRVLDFAILGNDRLVAVGGQDNLGRQIGWVRVINSDGTTLTELHVASDSSSIFLTGIAPLSDSLCVVVGADEWYGTRRPLYAYVPIDQNGDAYVDNATVVRTVTHSFRDVVVPANEGASDFCALYLLPDGFSIMRIQRDGAVVWDRPVRVGGSRVVIFEGNGLATDGDNLYVAGETHLVKRDHQEWGVGFVASLTPDGETRWVSRASYSQSHDAYWGVAVGSDRVYAVGSVSAFVSGDKLFGYGLLAEYAPDSGQLTKWFSFGRRDGYLFVLGATSVGGEPFLGGDIGDDNGSTRSAWSARIHDASRAGIASGYFQVGPNGIEPAVSRSNVEPGPEVQPDEAQ